MTLNPFQSTRLSRASTDIPIPAYDFLAISIHKALASLDVMIAVNSSQMIRFQSTRLSRASTALPRGPESNFIFQSTRLSRASTYTATGRAGRVMIFQSTRLSRASTHRTVMTIQALDISIHKALASLDTSHGYSSLQSTHFNPQGSREPRPTKAGHLCNTDDFNPQGSREPRPR